MAKRRGNGEGFVYRRKDGLWVGRYRIETDNGPKTKYNYSKIRKDAATKLAPAIAERNKGIVYSCPPKAPALWCFATVVFCKFRLKDVKARLAYPRHRPV